MDVGNMTVTTIDLGTMKVVTEAAPAAPLWFFGLMIIFILMAIIGKLEWPFALIILKTLAML